MKKLILIVLLLVNALISAAQSKFFKVYTDNGYDYGQSIIQLKDSSYMITGSSSSFVDAPSQAFMMKIDKNGNHLWAKDYGFEEADGGKRVLSAFDDSIFFIIGYTQSLVGNGFDILFVKTDSNGVQLDKKVIGTENWERINDAVIMGDSMLYLVGESTHTSTLNSNCYLMKMNIDGDTLWTKSWGSSGDDYLKAIHSFDANSFIAVGRYYNTDSLMTKGYVSKFDFNGNLLWEKQYGAKGDYWLNDFYLYNGGIYAVGGKVNPTYNDKDEFYLRINDDGTPNLWDFESANEGNIEAVGAILYANNTKSYVVTEFNNSYSAEHSYDVLYSRYENNLDYEWSNPSVPKVAVNFQRDDQFGELIPTLDGGWISVGTTPSESNGGAGVYVLKIKANDDFPVVNLASVNSLVELITIEQTEVAIYPNPANEVLVIDANGVGDVKIEIVDLYGKILLQTSLNSSLTLPVSDWRSGVYFVNIQMSNGAQRCVKILKQ